MHDAFGRELAVGDRVVVPFEVTQVQATKDYCNVSLSSLATMPGNDQPTNLAAINTRQTIRANEGDETRFVRRSDGAKYTLEPEPASAPAPAAEARAQVAPYPRRDPRNPALRFFDYEHLPPMLQEVSRPFCELARTIAAKYSPSAELSVALRKLLEAKDAAVRASLPAE